MKLEELKNNYRLIDLFVELVEIPSPSLKEEKVSKKILEIFNIYGIQAQYDSFNNIIAKVPASYGFKEVQPLLLSAHMDVVGGLDPVNVRLSQNGKFIETYKTRTLGADDKVGVAAIIDLAIKLNDLSCQIEHGPIEITFTRDEEIGMAGIKNLDTSKLHSKYAVIIDGEILGEHDNEGAGFTNVYIKVHGGKGGHSGINIQDKNRINAIKILSELDTLIPQGVYKADERGVVTSINAGVSVGGTAGISVAGAIKEAYMLGKNNGKLSEKYEECNMLDTMVKESALNVINTQASQSYSIRSSDPENEKELLNYINEQVKMLNVKYAGLIKIDMEVKTHLKPFVRSNDEFLSNVIMKAGEGYDFDCQPSSFHAGAETHVFANEKANAKNQAFVPVIIGLANLENIHSADEKLDWNSFLTGSKWLEDIVTTFARESKR
ncbi:MAG: M20/M25/M40 family metallo-hydrolase [Candidatus Gastranaerophilales bacterium]|nr:M20/M25/M40 family metallo-hydrolase [Candidatus Gastranaerophilales bacterium]